MPSKKPFSDPRFPVTSQSLREHFVVSGDCPECGGLLDEDHKCFDCEFECGEIMHDIRQKLIRQPKKIF